LDFKSENDFGYQFFPSLFTKKGFDLSLRTYLKFKNPFWGSVWKKGIVEQMKWLKCSFLLLLQRFSLHDLADKGKT
jgi:hypothetical protein